MWGWLKIAVASHLLMSAPSAVAQGSGTLEIVDAELLLSLGTTAHVVVLDARQRGIPIIRQELQRGVLFPINPNTLSLGFPRHLLSVDQVQRMLVLTEDGLWGMAPLSSRTGSPFLLREAELREIVSDSELNLRNWAIVRSRFPVGSGLVTFTRGEVFPVESSAADIAGYALVELDNRFTRSKFRQIETRLTEIDGAPTEVERMQDVFRIPLGIEFGEHIEFVDIPKVKDFLQEVDRSREHGGGAAFFQRSPPISNLFKRWTKYLRLNRPFRIECNEEIQQIESRITEASVAFRLGADIRSLSEIGINLGSEASVRATWGTELRKSSTLSDVSFETDAYIVNRAAQSTIFQFGNAETCPESLGGREVIPKFYIATIPGIAGRALDSAIMRLMADLDPSVNQLLSGQLQAACLRGGYHRILEFMINDLNIDESVARLIASKILKIDRSGEIPRGFFEC
jgi:hypothetical protein